MEVTDTPYLKHLEIMSRKWYESNPEYNRIKNTIRELEGSVMGIMESITYQWVLMDIYEEQDLTKVVKKIEDESHMDKYGVGELFFWITHKGKDYKFWYSDCGPCTDTGVHVSDDEFIHCEYEVFKNDESRRVYRVVNGIFDRYYDEILKDELKEKYINIYE